MTWLVGPLFLYVIERCQNLNYPLEGTVSGDVIHPLPVNVDDSPVTDAFAKFAS